MKFNKLLPADKKGINPLEQVIELYHAHSKSLAERVKEGKEAGRDTSFFLEMKQVEVLGAIIALGKVRDLQNYRENYDLMTVARRKEIMESTKTVS